MAVAVLKALDRQSDVYVYMVSIVAAASGLLFGFDTAVINGALIFLRREFGLTELWTEVAATSLLVGCVAGASIAGYLSDRFGRRRILILSAILFGVSAVGAAVPHNLSEFVVARAVGGIAIGVASMLAPLYIAEVAPPRIRGRLVSLNQMAIVTGMLLAYMVNWLLSMAGPASWRWMFASAMIPSLAFFVSLFFVPESPRWLTEFGRREEALGVLTRVAGRAEALESMREIEAAIAEETGTLAELLRPGLRTALLIAVALAVLQQVTGINTILYYGSIIFKEHVGNHSDSAAIGVNVIIGGINFIATIVALSIIDRLGRKAALMVSSGLMAVSLTALGAAFLIKPLLAFAIFTLIIVYTASFSVGMGPAVWVLMAEIFPTKVRGRAMSIATISLWVACNALTLTFLSLVKAMTISGTFWLYAVLSVVTFVFVWSVVPETKGKSLEEIERFWKSVLKQAQTLLP